MTRRTWHLTRRITLAFGLITAVLSCAISVLAARALWSTVQDEIEALAREEVEETELSWAAVAGPDLDAITRQLRAQHPHNRMAWRTWDTLSGEPRGDSGDLALLREAGLTGAVLRPGQLPRNLRWMSGRLSPELSFGILLDGTHQMQTFRRFALAATTFVLICTALALLAGALLSQRVARLLEAAARSARAAAEGETLPIPPAAPEEIRSVLEALHGTLQRIRSEAEKARLVTSGLAHELRSPLQNLVGETQVALLREREPIEYRQVLESHLEELGQLSRVVDNLVTLCSAGELRRQHMSEHFDLGAEVRQRFSREFQLALRRDVRIEIQTSGPLECNGDREALLLALRNVITNAIEWSPRGGTIDLVLRGSEQELEIIVEDTGPGVPMEERQKIFEPFHRGRAARGRRSGFGLGLALTRGAVEAHGGRVAVEQGLLGGARFRIVLPRRQTAPADPDGAGAPTAAGLHPARPS
jgi:signal transduction histidine kinase